MGSEIKQINGLTEWGYDVTAMHLDRKTARIRRKESRDVLTPRAADTTSPDRPPENSRPPDTPFSENQKETAVGLAFRINRALP